MIGSFNKLVQRYNPYVRATENYVSNRLNVKAKEIMDQHANMTHQGAYAKAINSYFSISQINC